MGLEEVPAQMIQPAAEQLRQCALQFCKNHQLGEVQVRSFSTPRRLALVLENLPDQQPNRTKELKGPPLVIAQTPEGEWTKAAEGFARKHGIDLDAAEIRKIGGKAYLFVSRNVAGQSTGSLLKDNAPNWLQQLSFPKNMRWGSYRTRLIRPVRWLVFLWNGTVLPLSVENVQSSRETRGHRFLCETPVALSHAKEYEAALEQAHVVADPDKRKQRILDQIRELEGVQGFRVETEVELLDEVTNLVEWPTALVGEFDERFLELPPEALVTSMAVHQRYFPVYDARQSNQLLNRFVTVRNGDERSLTTVQQGNERVLRARLSDAQFFFDEDRKHAPEYFLAKGGQAVFFQGRGSQQDRGFRIQQLTERIAEQLDFSPEQRQQASRIAELCKFDLQTQMVYEFPELQGVMGGHYARLLEEPEVVCRGIREHYLPGYTGDALPQNLQTVPAALADRLDQLAVAFSLGMIPSGSADPFALRRAAQGVMQLLLGLQLELCSQDLVAAAVEVLTKQQNPDLETVKLHQQLAGFLLQRQRWQLREQGLAHDVVEAVLKGEQTQPLWQLRMAQYLESVQNQPSFKLQVEAVLRAVNLSQKNPLPPEFAVKPERFAHKAEHALHVVVAALPDHITSPESFMETLAQLEVPITRFFTEILVMDENPETRYNRLGLCQWISAWSLQHLDLRELVFPGE